MLGRSDSRARHLVLLLTLVVTALALVARLAWWQVIRRDDLAIQARLQTSLRTEVPSQRGAIYDRSGVVALASTVERNRLVAATDDMTGEQRRELGTQLVPLLGLDATGVTALQEKLGDPRPYVVLARDLAPDVSARLRSAIADGHLLHVGLEPEAYRVYPQAGGAPETSLASHLLGFVNREGVGQYGIKQRYQDVLAGSPKVVLAQKDVNAH